MNFKYAHTFEGWAADKDREMSKKVGEEKADKEEEERRKRERAKLCDEAFVEWLRGRGGRKIDVWEKWKREGDWEKEKDKENCHRSGEASVNSEDVVRPWRKHMKTKSTTAEEEKMLVERALAEKAERDKRQEDIDALFMEWLCHKEVVRKEEKVKRKKEEMRKKAEEKKVREKKWLKKVVISSYQGDVAKQIRKSSLNYLKREEETERNERK